MTQTKKRQTIKEENHTVENASMIIDPENQTDKNDGLTKPQKKQTTLKWSLVTDIETKSIVAKAAKKAGVGLWEWSDRKLREAGIAELSHKPQPPAKVEDVADLIKGFAEQMQANQEAAQKAQDDLIQRQGQQIAALAETVKNSQPKSIKEMIFGRKKDD